MLVAAIVGTDPPFAQLAETRRHHLHLLYIERIAKANLIILELLTKYSNRYLTSRIYAVFNIVIRETTLDQSLINVTSSTASSPRQRPRTQINHLLLACYLLK